MIKTKTKKQLKRALSCVLAFVMTVSMSTVLPAAAEEVERYPYVIFAADERAGVTVDADSFTLNGNAHSNGEFSVTSQYSNINGKITDVDDVENKEETEEVFDVSRDMIFMHNKLTNKYFTENCLTFDESYTYSDNNVNINNPLYVTGELNFEGNVTLNNAIGAVSDIELSDGNLNGNNTVIYSKFGDIDISGSQTSVNGLIYAPFGTVTIDSENFNLNGIIIAQSVVISCEGNVNINYNYGVGEMVGVESEELSLDEADIPYLKDADSDELFDVFEIIIGTDKTNPDTDGDKLTDGYEVLYLGTDPAVVDSDENGVSDADEDFDEDGLTNIQEYEKETDPYNDDTDGDELKDGEEVNTYFTNPIVADTDEDGLDDGDEIHFNTNPLNPDTDGDGIPDGNEKRFQTFIHESENKDSAVTEVRVSMNATGNLEKTTTIESIMGKDILCSEVVGLIGEPFSIETTSQFEKATITYVIDKSKLGETEFDNLLFLWYDEENNEFVELDTILDEENSTVSVETTHFSCYMLVDQVEWFEAWRKASLYFEEHNEPLASVICYDCSGSMISNDPNFTYNVFDDTGRIVHSYSTCYRKLAIDNFIDSMKLTDLTALVSFETSATLVSGFSDDKNALKNLVKPYNNGLTNAQAAIDIALDELSTAKHWYSRHIILLSDGDVNVTDAQLLQAKKAEIKIHTIGLGAGANNKELQKYADETGGRFFVAATAEELEEIYQDLSIKNHFDLKGLPDEDEDGLPDEFEVSGMILPNGQIFYTDSEIKDCDGDNLADGEEIFIDYSETQFVIKKDKRGGNIEYSTVVFGYNSNPWVEDTDGDGYTDDIDFSALNYDDINGLLFQSDHKMGLGYDGESLADDLTKNDYSYNQMYDINSLFFIQLTNDVEYNIADFKTMSKLLFAFGNDADDMIEDLIDKFVNGTNKTVNIKTKDGNIDVPVYTNDALYNKVQNDEQVQEYFKFVKNEFVKQLKKYDGNLNLARNNMQNIVKNSNKYKIAFSRDKSNYLTNGMTISINDLWGSNVSVTDYSCEDGKFSGILRFSLYDHFGLDQPDVEKIYVNLAGFRAWFVLQHYNLYNGKYEPFINLMEYEVSFSGKL